MKRIFITLSAALLSSMLFACTGAPAPAKPGDEPAKPAEALKAATAADTTAKPAAVYRCAMHPDQTSTDPKASCPVCGMAMELVHDK